MRENHGEIDITLVAEAAEYRKTVSMAQAEQATLPGANPIQPAFEVV